MKLHFSRLLLTLSITLYAGTALSSDKDATPQQANSTLAQAPQSGLSAEQVQALEELQKAVGECREVTQELGHSFIRTGIIQTFAARESMLADLEQKNQGKRCSPHTQKRQADALAWIAQERARIQALRTAGQISIPDALKEVTHSMRDFTQQYDRFDKGR